LRHGAAIVHRPHVVPELVSERDVEAVVAAAVYVAAIGDHREAIVRLGPDGAAVAAVPWLVVMREPAAATLRIGKGYYQWTFATAGCVSAMHIHIERMDAIPDADGGLLRAAQAELPYPWLQPATLRSFYRQRADENRELDFLYEFEAPLALPAR
jgi:hypothetical protein